MPLRIAVLPRRLPRGRRRVRGRTLAGRGLLLRGRGGLRLGDLAERRLEVVEDEARDGLGARDRRDRQRAVGDDEDVAARERRMDLGERGMPGRGPSLADLLGKRVELEGMLEKRDVPKHGVAWVLVAERYRVL